ncbi:MAG: peptidoglycan DD-metalloendopeptidase family protein [Gammaproteobacteria bacterium]|nr:peptidoglycan DD-metalloendopeptidase family protein [Gammaproteobacteria bacterium]
MTTLRLTLIRACLVYLVAINGGCAQGSNPYSYGYYSGKTLTKTPTASEFHTVAKGETLYSIAFVYGQDVRDVAAWNGLRAPYTIYPKQQLRVLAPRKPRQAISTTSTPAAAITPRVTVTRSPATPGSRGDTDDTKISWQWPTNGKIIATYSAADAGKKGVDITGQNGQPVYAAADGRVVYSGDGLRGYGKLVIIKHNETFYSAYAHNAKLRILEEQPVKKGQQIADMGSSGTDKVMLHFEVRRDGKPVDPMLYLPKRR